MRFTGTASSTGLIAAALLALGVPRALGAADPTRLALVIGESPYATLPQLPVCAGSARTVAGALRHLGFEVTQKLNTTSGETDAALADFRRKLRHAPGATPVLYFCGYAAGLGERAFLLPITAAIERRFDLITQGILAGSAATAMAAPGAAGGLLALDVFARPGDRAPIPLERLAPTAMPPGGGLVAVLESNPNDAETPLAAALARGLSTPSVEVGDLVAGLRRQVAAVPGSTVAVAATAPGKAWLAGAPPPPSPPPAAPPKPKPPPAPLPAPAKPAESPPAPPAAAPSAPAAPSFPDEAYMTPADRRRVQVALALRGYYSGRIDGLFGPETRASIRRFQQEIGAEPSGILTGEQAGRLLTPGNGMRGRPSR